MPVGRALSVQLTENDSEQMIHSCRTWTARGKASNYVCLAYIGNLNFLEYIFNLW